jgi:hypothetical protein
VVVGDVLYPHRLDAGAWEQENPVKRGYVEFICLNIGVILAQEIMWDKKEGLITLVFDELSLRKW